MLGFSVANRTPKTLKKHRDGILRRRTRTRRVLLCMAKPLRHSKSRPANSHLSSVDIEARGAVWRAKAGHPYQRTLMKITALRLLSVSVAISAKGDSNSPLGIRAFKRRHAVWVA